MNHQYLLDKKYISLVKKILLAKNINFEYLNNDGTVIELFKEKGFLFNEYELELLVKNNNKEYIDENIIKKFEDNNRDCNIDKILDYMKQYDNTQLSYKIDNIYVSKRRFICNAKKIANIDDDINNIVFYSLIYNGSYSDKEIEDLKDRFIKQELKKRLKKN